MSLKKRLADDMKTCMKAREAGKARLSVVQMVRAAVLQVEKDKRVELDDAGIIEVLVREERQRRQAMEEYERLGVEEQVAKLKYEIGVLREYMPAEMSEEQIRELIADAISSTGAQSAKHMGKVMSLVIPKTRGRADGQMVSNMVRQMIEELSKE